jgi:nucleoside 2-deoxyribosyltransferase
MLVYLAGPYAWKHYIKVHAEQLEAIGVGVTSSWLEEKHSPTTALAELPDDMNTKYALADLRDIDRADAFVLFAVPAHVPAIPRAGRHVEFGYALAKGLPIYVVGPERENIFHYLPGKVHHFDTWNELMEFFARHPRVMGV